MTKESERWRGATRRDRRHWKRGARAKAKTRTQDLARGGSSVGGGVTVPRQMLAQAIKLQRARTPVQFGAAAYTGHKRDVLRWRNSQAKITARGLLRGDALYGLLKGPGVKTSKIYR